VSTAESAPFGLREDELSRIQSVLQAHRNVNQAIIYGSRAMGTHRAGSDIDITLRGNLDRTECQQIETELDNLDLPYKIDLSHEPQIENQTLLAHIHQHGQTLYKKQTNE